MMRKNVGGNAEKGMKYPHFFIISMITAKVQRCGQANSGTNEWRI
jgi:hypothetical protein